MTPFQAKIEELLASGAIDQESYDACKPYFGITDQKPIEIMCCPALARALIATNSDNRVNPKANIVKLAAQMRRGEVHDNQMPMGVNDKGERWNGEGRCRACILAGCSFPTWIRFNLPQEKFSSIDTGAPRQLEDDAVFQPGFNEKFGRRPTKKEFQILKAALTEGGNPVGVDWRCVDPGTQNKLIAALGDEYHIILPHIKTMKAPVLAAFVRALNAAGPEDKERLKKALLLCANSDQLDSEEPTPPTRCFASWLGKLTRETNARAMRLSECCSTAR